MTSAVYFGDREPREEGKEGGREGERTHRSWGPKVATTQTVTSVVVAKPMRKRFWLVARI